MIRRPPRSTLFPTRRSSDLTPFVFAERLQGTRAAIKKAIMDQRRVAGVGNIYANEALFEAGINPSKPTRSEEHTSELQSRLHLVCRLLLGKKKKHKTKPSYR